MPSRLDDRGPGRLTPAEELTASVGALCSALKRLDHAAVEECCANLQALTPQFAALGARLESGKALELRTRLKLAQALSEHACQLYAGWGRMAALQGTAYTPTGDEAAFDSVSSVALKG